MPIDVMDDGRPATARVPCSNAANIGERKTWTQSEFFTWQNSVSGHKREFQLYLSAIQFYGSTSQVVSKSLCQLHTGQGRSYQLSDWHLGDTSQHCQNNEGKWKHWSQPTWKVTIWPHSFLNRPTWLMRKMTFSPAFWHQSLMSECRQLTVIIYHIGHSITIIRSLVVVPYFPSDFYLWGNIVIFKHFYPLNDFFHFPIFPDFLFCTANKSLFLILCHIPQCKNIHKCTTQ